MVNNQWLGRALISFSIVACLTGIANAKAYFAPRDVMIQRSDYIAVVNITRVEKTETKGDHWTYSQQASAQVVQKFKGDLPHEIRMFGGEDFICARVNLQPGRALVFLSRDQGLLRGSNWHLSVRPISSKNTIEWYDKSGSAFSLKETSLDTVLQELKHKPAE